MKTIFFYIKGTLMSDRWDRNFWFTASFVLLWLIPVTAGFMVDGPLKDWRRILHIITVVLLWIYFMVVLGFWSYDYATANHSTSGNARNQANDPRWCCVNYNVPGSKCLNTVGCTPGIGQADLIINPLFLFMFWYNFILILFLITDFGLVMGLFQPAVKDYLLEYEQNKAKPTISSRPTYNSKIK